MASVPTAVFKEADEETAAQRRAQSVLKYVPLTGPVPPDLQPGETFAHRDIILTPTLAQQCLDCNASFNRRESEIYTETWAKQMLAGEWDAPSPQPMVFSRDGELIDGQTRCKALVLAAKTNPDLKIPMTVEHNWDPAIFAKLDSGRKRTVGQMLNEKNGHQHAANVSLCLKYLENENDYPSTAYVKWGKATNPSTEGTRKFLDENPDMRTCLTLARPLKSEAHMSHSAATVAMFLIRRHALGNPLALKVVHEFFNGVVDARRCKDGDPRYALNRYADRVAFNGVKPKLSETLGMILKAWERWCLAEHTTRMLWEHGKAFMPPVYVPNDWAEVPRKWGITLDPFILPEAA